MSVFPVQNDFTHGEIDPRLKARPDLALFNKSAAKMRNVVVTPTGGARRRFGTRYIARKTVAAMPDREFMMTSFEYDEVTKYLLIFTHLKLEIYKNDVLIKTIVTQYSGTLLLNNEVKFTKTQNALICFNANIPPQLLSRSTTDELTWSFSTLKIKNYPAYDFAKDYDDINFTLGDVVPGDTTLTSDYNVFRAEHKGGIFIGIGLSEVVENGVARITSYNSPTSVSVTILQEFGHHGMVGSNAYLGETAWNTKRGWPISGTFYEGRLAIGGCKALPATVFMSVSNDVLNFDIGVGDDSDSIQYTMSSDDINIIKYVVSDRSFQIFTTNGEYVSPQSESSALTPGNTSFRKQTNNGSESVIPLVIDNQTFYVRKGGKSIMSFVYDNDRGSYQSTTASIFSPHLIKNPIDGAVLQGSSEDEANYMFYVNSEGSLAVYQSMAEQNISAWTLATTGTAFDDLEDITTDGLFRAVTNVGSDIYFIITRTVAGIDYQYLEKLDWSVYTDCSIVTTAVSKVVSGLSHLEGKGVQVKADGYVFEENKVMGGVISLEDDATDITVGLAYTPLITPNSVNIMGQQGSTLYTKKRLVRMFIDYYESLGIYINDNLIPYQSFGDLLDEAPVVKTDVYEYVNLTDWSLREEIQITQKDPLPMQIIGIGYEIEVL
jgi:hypothetical protein